MYIGPMAATHTARALLAQTDVSVGVDVSVGASTPKQWLPVEASLANLLPDGSIRRGTTLTVRGHGSVTLATALAAEASRQGNWVATVGMGDLGVSALAERKAELKRWVLVDLPVANCGTTGDTKQTANVLGALVSGFDLVLAGPQIRLGDTQAKRLLSRMREHGTSLIWALDCGTPAEAAGGLSPEVRMAIDQPHWRGIHKGHGCLLARQVEVTVGGRGAASRPRRILLWLPSSDGRVACVEHSNLAFIFGNDPAFVRSR